MSLTPEGQRAYEIWKQVYEDPASRIDQARKDIGDLWESLPDGPAKLEVGDVATQLSRLSDSLSYHPPENISQQAGPE